LDYKYSIGFATLFSKVLEHKYSIGFATRFSKVFYTYFDLKLKILNQYIKIMCENPNEEKKDVMNDFKKVIVDMTNDILTTFPEYETKLNVHLRNLLVDSVSEEEQKDSLNIVYEHCKVQYPERFFEILYQNEELFTDKTKYPSAEFLPGIHFSELWSENITDKTRETIWKYLQLVLFTVVSTISDGASFGDAAKLFEAIDQDEFKNKLGETISQMHAMFNSNADDNDNDSADTNSNPKSSTRENINVGDLPNPQDIHDHVAGMLDGKLGKLAKEIADETVAELNMDMENVGSVNDVFKRLLKNPSKLMSLVKSVGSKLDQKLKSGDINETELLSEASEMVKKMKDMPGMGDLQSMMSKMGMNIPGGSKMNMGAMQAHLDRNMKASQQKDRMRSKLDAKRAAAQQAAQQAVEAQQAALAQAEEAQAQAQSKLHKVSNLDGVETLVFSTGENVQRSKPSDKKKKKKKN